MIYHKKFNESEVSKKYFEEIYILPGYQGLKIKAIDIIFEVIMNKNFKEKESFFNQLQKLAKKVVIDKSEYNKVMSQTQVDFKSIANFVELPSNTLFEHLYFGIKKLVNKEFVVTKDKEYAIKSYLQNS